MRVFDSFKRNSPNMFDDFEPMLNKICELNVKYLTVLLTDLKTRGYIHVWSGEYHRRLQERVELAIMERTLLK